MSVDTKRPKSFKRAPVTEYRCQFCNKTSPVADWKAKHQNCPKCGKAYDAAAWPGLEATR